MSNLALTRCGPPPVAADRLRVGQRRSAMLGDGRLAATRRHCLGGRHPMRMAVLCKYASAQPQRRRPQRNSTFIKDRNRARLGVYINEEITVKEVRLINADREMLGVFPTSEALQKAEAEGVDLILISPNATPPLCQLLEWGKYKYQLEKQDKEKRRKQREARIEVKELKMRPGTDTHDYNVRIRKARKEIEKGNRIKLVCVFRGRENQFREQGYQLFERFVSDLGATAAIEKRPKMEGRMLVMVLGPPKP